MALDLRLLFYPKTKEYEVVSPDGYRLWMSEPEFNAIKGKMNGIALAFAERARERKKQAQAAPQQQSAELSTSSSFSGQPSLSEDPTV